MNKKGFEISINFLVMLILAISIFSFGLIFVSNLFEQAAFAKNEFSAETERQLEAALDRNERVAFPISSRNIVAGDSAIFGLGVINVLDHEETFTVTIECLGGVDIKGNDFDVADGDPCATEAGKRWTVGYQPNGKYIYETFDLKELSKKTIPVVIQHPKEKPRGTYSFLATITYEEDNQVKEYGGAPNSFYLEVNYVVFHIDYKLKLKFNPLPVSTFVKPGSRLYVPQKSRYQGIITLQTSNSPCLSLPLSILSFNL